MGEAEEFESSGVLYWYWDWHWYWWPGILLVLVDITESENNVCSLGGGKRVLNTRSTNVMRKLECDAYTVRAPLRLYVCDSVSVTRIRYIRVCDVEGAWDRV